MRKENIIATESIAHEQASKTSKRKDRKMDVLVIVLWMLLIRDNRNEPKLKIIWSFILLFDYMDE